MGNSHNGKWSIKNEKKCQLSPIMKHHFNRIRLAKFKVLKYQVVDILRYLRKWKERKSHRLPVGVQIGGSTLETNSVISGKVRGHMLSSPAISLPAIHSRENPKQTKMFIYSSIVCKIYKIRNNPNVHPQVNGYNVLQC